MNERNFRIFLEENEIDANVIKNFLLKLSDYENYLKKENLNLDSVNPKKLVEYTEYLVSINKDSVLDFLRAILSYANYSKKYDFIIETIDIVESYNAMDTLFSRIAEIHGEQMRNEIFKDLSIPPLGVHPEKKPNFTKIINKLKKFYLCYCPWVRGALKEGTDDELSNYFCHCSAGWYKLYWDLIFEQPTRVEPFKSALKGDFECNFAIHIPDNFNIE